MVKLNAKSPFDKLLPVQVGNCKLSDVTPTTITSIAPQRGRLSEVSDSMKRSHGIAYPGVNRVTGKDQLRCIWFGGGQAMLLGQVPIGLRGAAMTDQSDGWAVMQLKGKSAEAVLARLVPIDLRRAVFKRGHTARTLVFHMSASITRTGAEAFDIMIFRSMAKTAVHELKVAMKSIAAQNT